MPSVTDLIGPAGPLEALLDEPSTGAAPSGAAVVFAHPHPQFGGTMHTKAVYQGAKGLARIGCAVLRFNFRGVGRSAGEFDQGDGEKADFTAALDYMAARYPGAPLWAAGFSFGSWVALEVGAEDDRRLGADRHRAAGGDVGVGPGYTFERTLASTKPKFFVQGEADEVCRIEAMWSFYGKLRRAEGARRHRHGQSPVRRARREEVGEALEDLLGDFPET